MRPVLISPQPFCLINTIPNSAILARALAASAIFATNQPREHNLDTIATSISFSGDYVEQVSQKASSKADKQRAAFKVDSCNQVQFRGRQILQGIPISTSEAFRLVGIDVNLEDIDPASPLLPVSPWFSHKGKRVIYLHMLDTPSTSEPFHYKPKLVEYAGRECPAEPRRSALRIHIPLNNLHLAL